MKAAGLYIVYGHCDTELGRFGDTENWVYSIQFYVPETAPYETAWQLAGQYLDREFHNWRQGGGGVGLRQVIVAEQYHQADVCIKRMLDLCPNGKQPIYSQLLGDSEKFRAVFNGAPITDYETEIILCQTYRTKLKPA